MKTIRYMLTEALFVWMLVKLKVEEVQRHAYRIVLPRYPMKMPAEKPKVHPLDDPRLRLQKAELN